MIAEVKNATEGYKIGRRDACREFVSKLSFFNTYYGWEVLELLGLNTKEQLAKMKEDLLEREESK